MIRTALVAASLLGSGPALACAVALDIPPAWAGARVAGLSLHVPHAVVAALPTVPRGWRLTVDNTSPLGTRLAGQAVVGAAFLAPADLAAAITLAPAEAQDCAALGGAGAVRLTLTFYRDDRMRPVRLPAHAVRITD